jgi:hypothetical protein
MSEAKCYHLEVELILHPLPGEAMKKDAIICVSRSSVTRRLHCCTEAETRLPPTSAFTDSFGTFNVP